MTEFEKSIINILERSGELTAREAAQIMSGLAKTEQSLEGYLLQKGKVSSEMLLQAKSAASQTPRFGYDESQPIKRDVLKEIPVEAAEQYRMVPIDKEGQTLVVGMVDPTDYKAHEALRFVLLRSDLNPRVVVISEWDFKKILQLYKGLRGEVKSALEELEQSLRAEPIIEKGKVRPSDQLVKEAPITKMVAVILKHAIEGRASDIHIEPTRTD